jgi:hypothetical protein
MSNSCVLEFLEVIQHHLAKGLLTVAKFSVLVFQIDGVRLVKLVNEEITVSQLGFNDYCLIRPAPDRTRTEIATTPTDFRFIKLSLNS